MLLNIRPRDTSIGVNLKPAWNKLVGCHAEKNLFSESNHPHVPYSCLWASVRVGDAKALMLVERPLLWHSYNHSVTMPHPQSLSCESPILKSGFCFSLCMYYTLPQARSGSSNEMWVASDKAFRIFLAKDWSNWQHIYLHERCVVCLWDTGQSNGCDKALRLCWTAQALL